MINAYWFNQRYVYNMLKLGTKYILWTYNNNAKYYNKKNISSSLVLIYQN